MSLQHTTGSFRASIRRFANRGGQRAAWNYGWRYHDGKWSLVSDDGEETLLISSKNKRVPLKDFAMEVRATMDVEQFVSQCALLLNVTETSSESVLEAMLKQMDPSPNGEWKSSLFSFDSVLSWVIHGATTAADVNFVYDHSWICAMCEVPSLTKRLVGIARLQQPLNMGVSYQEVRLIVLILCPDKEKGTKNAWETGRTFATLLADMNLRRQLLEAPNEDDFRSCLKKHAQEILTKQSKPESVPVTVTNLECQPLHEEEHAKKKCKVTFGHGLFEDLKRRLPHYWSDFKDGVIGPKSVQKCISTTFFLYFACLLPCIAFGSLNDRNTHGKIDVRKVITGQAIGGLFYALFSGQFLVILLTTAPLALYIKIIASICDDFNLDFFDFYAVVGLWCCFFLVLFAVFDLSKLMAWSTRSTEEIFALFICVAFFVDAGKDLTTCFRHNYDPCLSNDTLIYNNNTLATHMDETGLCRREQPLLFIILMLGTLFFGVFLFNMNKTPYLQASKREILSDYSLPVAVLVFSFVGSYLFHDIDLEHFRFGTIEVFHKPIVKDVTVGFIFGGMALGFPLALLFFMDQNISAAMVNNPANKLQKGPAYHWDLLIVALLNAVLSIFGLPWMHGALPHSPLHVRALADVEDHVDQGHVHEIISRVRETRLSTVFAHIMIGLSLLLLPYPLAYIPTAVLNGLFLYMAVTSLSGNQMFERTLLLFTEQRAYPPNHYIRRVPQRKIHLFTGLQLLQLGILCTFGFFPWPYIKMGFPLIILLLLPLRHKVVPFFVDRRYLQALDG